MTAEAPIPAEVPPEPRSYARPVEMAAIGVVIALDQLTKLLVRLFLPLHESVNVIPGLFDLTHVQNTGAAFGLLNAADFPYKPAVIDWPKLAPEARDRLVVVAAVHPVDPVAADPVLRVGGPLQMARRPLLAGEQPPR